MQRRGGGGGLGGGGDVRAARQLLLSLFDGAVAGGGAGARRGGGVGRGGNRQSAGSRPRDGEWPCQCGFGTNRPHRTACFACGRSRDVADVGGATARQSGGGRGAADRAGPKGGRPSPFSNGYQQGKGPVGAGGSRPLLGWGGRSPLDGPAGGGHCKGVKAVPNSSGKGPPAATAWGKSGGRAKAEHGGGTKGTCKGGAGDRGKAPSVGGGEGKGTGWVRPSAVYDGDGFQLVQPRRVRAKGEDHGDCATGDGETCGGETTACTTRPRWADDDVSDDGYGMDDGAGACDDEDDGEEGRDGWTEDPRQLRTTFEEHAKAVKEMEKRGQQGAALETLRAARDEAERRWRETKPPAPLPKRLEWAESKLQKSQSTLTRLRMALDAFDEETDRRRAEMCERIQQAQAWCDWRRQQLDDLHAEAADRVPGRRDETTHTSEAAELRRRIRSQTLPEMQAILEDVQEGTPLHSRLALLVAGLADAEAQSGRHHWEEGPTQYHLYDGDSTHEAHDDGDDDMGDMGGSHEDGCDGGGERDGPTTWKPAGTGRWTKAGGCRGKGVLQRSDEATATTTGIPNHAARQRADGANRHGEAGGGSGDQVRDFNATPVEDGGQATPNGTDGDERTRTGKSRRLCSEDEIRATERAESDARRARELQRQLEQATSVQQQSFNEGRGGFGSEAALSAAAQKFVLDVQRAQAQAGEMGVEAVSSDGRSLLELSPSELKQWVDEHLDGDGNHA